MENEVIENVDDGLVGGVVESNEVDNRPTREFLLECFNYVPDTGEFRWNVRPLQHFINSNTMNAWNTKYAGKEIKYIKKGHRLVSLKYNDISKVYYIQKLIWCMIYGEFPISNIIHINKDTLDNRLVNLKENEKICTEERWSNKAIDLENKEYFDKYIRYEEESGKLFWKDRDVSEFKNDAYYRAWKTSYLNKEITKVDRDGYYRVALRGKEYKAHRVIWIMCYNEDPKKFHIDHINGIKNDNRISNLRKATSQENSRNHTRLSSHNTTGYRGIYKGNTEGSWVVRLQLNCKLTTVGTFYSLEEAIEARRNAVEKHYGEFGGLV